MDKKKYEIKTIDGTLYAVSSRLSLADLRGLVCSGSAIVFDDEIIINMPNVISIKGV